MAPITVRWSTYEVGRRIWQLSTLSPQWTSYYLVRFTAFPKYFSKWTTLPHVHHCSNSNSGFRRTVGFLAWHWMVWHLPLGDELGEKGWGRKQEFLFKYVMFKTFARHERGAVWQAVGCHGVEFQGEGDVSLRFISMWVMFNAEETNEITWGRERGQAQQWSLAHSSVRDEIEEEKRQKDWEETAREFGGHPTYRGVMETRSGIRGQHVLNCWEAK